MEKSRKRGTGAETVATLTSLAGAWLAATWMVFKSPGVAFTRISGKVYVSAFVESAARTTHVAVAAPPPLSVNCW
jgi:hypothetical protein